MKSILILITCFCACGIHGQSFDLQWVRQMGGNLSDAVMAMESDADGDLYVTGTFKGPADFDPGAGVAQLEGQAVDSWEKDVFVGKYDPSGNLLWVTEFSGPQYKFANDLTIDVNGSILVAGFFEGTVTFGPSQAFTAPAGTYQSFVARLNHDGILLWVKVFGSCSDVEGAVDVATDAAGNCIVTGVFSGTADFDPGAATHTMTTPGYLGAYILKLDPAGNFIWSRQIDDPNFAYATALAVDTAGNTYAGGAFSSTADLDPGPGIVSVTTQGGNDTYLVKLDPDGAFLWERHYGGEDPDILRTVTVGASGAIYLAGGFENESTDFNPGPGTCYLASYGWQDIYVMKLDASGDFVWCKGLGGEEYDGIWATFIDDEENLCIAGQFRMEMDFDPGPGVFPMASAGSGADDAFVLHLDSDGNFGWAFQLHGNMNYIMGLGAGPAGSLYAAGAFQNPTDFDPGPGVHSLVTASGYSDAFIMRLDDVLSAPELSAGNGMNCYPNPVGESLTVQLYDPSPDARLRLIGINGDLVQEWTNLSAGNTVISTEHLAAGMYVVELQDRNAVQRIRVVR